VPVAELALNQQIALAAIGGVDNQIDLVAGAGFAHTLPRRSGTA
jgi:hypothetical protein